MRKRHTNGGIRKVCAHTRRQWAACEHPWHFSFKTKDHHHRFSLDKHFGKHIDSKTKAEELAGDLRKAIRNNTFGAPTPVASMSLQQLVDTYVERYVQVERTDTADDFKGGLKVICETTIKHPTGGTVRFGDWPLADVVTDTIERYREARRTIGTGLGGTNRSLSRLRAVFNWGIKVGYLDATPSSARARRS